MSVQNQPITTWYRITKNGLAFNHIENGHCSQDIPTPVTKQQEKDWKGYAWDRRYGHLINGVVVESEKS